MASKKKQEPQGPTELEVEELVAARAAAAKLDAAVRDLQGGIRKVKQDMARTGPVTVQDGDISPEDVLGGDKSALSEALTRMEGDQERLERGQRQQSKRVRQLEADVGRKKLEVAYPAIRDQADELLGSILAVHDAAKKLQEAISAAEAEAGATWPEKLNLCGSRDLRVDVDRSTATKIASSLVAIYGMAKPKSITAIPEGVRVEIPPQTKDRGPDPTPGARL